MAGESAALDAGMVRRWATTTRLALAARRAEIDALNVFPVPDGDTGTNMYLTFDGALEATVMALAPSRDEPAAPGSLIAAARTFARSMVFSARGNSGVILSQFVAGAVEGITAAMAAGSGASSSATVSVPELAHAVRLADDYAWRAVAEPVHGTMLSVSRAVADAAATAAEQGSDLQELCSALTASARAAVLKTRLQLKVLTEAGVVDAGAVGLLLLVESLARVVTPGGGVDWALGREALRPYPGLSAAAPVTTISYAGPAYEVMFRVSDVEREELGPLRRALAAHGESLVVSGGEDTVTVHVHSDEPTLVLRAAGRFGAVEGVRISRLLPERDAPAARHGRSAVVACATGEGVVATLRAAGAIVVESGPGNRASTGQLVDACRSCGTSTVIVLPDDPDTRLVADSAARLLADEGLTVAVIPTDAVVQGLAAVAVHRADDEPDEVVAAMSAAASATRYGAVSVATRPARTPAGECAPGDVLGFVGGQITVIGDDLGDVTTHVVRELLRPGGDLVTVVSGAEALAQLTDVATSAALAARPNVEVVTMDGGQPVYVLLLGVE